MSDDLFSPTVREHPVPRKRPWRPESIFYASFFGGPLTAGLLGTINARRLGLPGGKVALTALAGVAGFGLWLAAAAMVDGNNLVRLAGSVTGSLAWLVVIAFQRGPFRTHLYGGGEAASLILPGIVTAALLAILQAAIILVAVR